MALAPIALFTYKRLKHTRQTVSSLLRNPEASQSMLYVFSDGPKRETDREDVRQVREYLRSISGFRAIVIRENERNVGLADSVIQGVSEVIDKHGEAIVVEDDLVVARHFLSFMNSSLKVYKDDRRIFSIGGYSPPISIPETYGKDVYVACRSESWGWATWQDRWQLADWNVEGYEEFLKSKSMRRRFCRGGDDALAILQAQMNGKSDSWSTRWNYTHFLHDAYTVRPVRSLAHNIGADGSGTHSRDSDMFDVTLDDDFSPIPVPDLKPNRVITTRFATFNDQRRRDLLGIFLAFRRRQGIRVVQSLNWLVVRVFSLVMRNCPISRYFGIDRGQSIARFYIERFLAENRGAIQGDVLEVAESTYTQRFGGSRVRKSCILRYEGDHTGDGDIVGDLETGVGLPVDTFDCFIMTQTLPFLRDVRAALRHAVYMLKPGGQLLLTVSGISQISRYDYDRWGHFWNFTDKGLMWALEGVVPAEMVTLKTWGNVKAATAYLYGISATELRFRDLEKQDHDYQVIISAVVRKPEVDQ